MRLNKDKSKEKNKQETYKKRQLRVNKRKGQS